MCQRLQDPARHHASAALVHLVCPTGFKPLLVRFGTEAAGFVVGLLLLEEGVHQRSGQCFVFRLAFRHRLRLLEILVVNGWRGAELRPAGLQHLRHYDRLTKEEVVVVLALVVVLVLVRVRVLAVVLVLVRVLALHPPPSNKKSCFSARPWIS